MLRHVMTGAAAVLTVGMLAVGCSDDGDTIIQGSNTPLNNQDQFPATSIFANQVSADGGGISPNDTNVTGQRVIWSCDICWSDGTFQGDNSALVLFTTAGGTSAPQKLWVTHYNGQTLTQPVNLIGVDQNELAALPANVLSSVVALQLNTQNYFANNQTQQTGLQAITQNDKVWVLLYSAVTFTNNPANATTQVQTVGSNTGPHRTIYYTAFRPGSRNNNQETRTDFIGSGTTSVNLQFGWVLPAIEVVPTSARSGPANDIGNNNTPAMTTPASNVQSFGLISDGFAGQTQFGGNGLPLTGGALGTAAQSAYTRAVAVNGSYRGAVFNGGEQTQLVHLFYTQILSSLSTGGGSVARSGNGTFLEGGARLAAFNASFNMATLTFETPTEFNPAVRRNATGSVSTSPGTGFYPTFFGYNAHVFYKYADASLIVTTGADPLSLGGQAGVYDNTGADEGGQLNANTFHEDIAGVATFVDDGDGTSSIVVGSTLDLSSYNSAPGVHDLVNPNSVGGGLGLNAVNREIANYNIGGGFPFVFGADESLGDTTVFFALADNTRSGTGDQTPNTIVRGGYAAAINNGTTGTGNGTLVAGSPFAWSTHAGAEQSTFIGGQLSGATDVKNDPLVAPGQLNGGDGAFDVSPGSTNDEDSNGGVFQGGTPGGQASFYFVPTMNRTGEYVSIGYMQDTGISSNVTSASFHRGLKVVTYQTFQTFGGSSATTQGSLTQVNLNLRFSAPQEISQTGAGVQLVQDPNTLSGINTSAETQTRWDALPVSNFGAQSLLAYRCGYQSNNRVIHYLWEQSDGTEDRAFSRQITYVTNATGTPSASTLGPVIEYETGNLVSAHLNTNDLVLSTGERSTFTFIDGNVSIGSTFYGTDMGGTDNGQGGIGGGQVLQSNAGSLFVVFGKITDGTSSDGDFGNAEVIMNTVIGNTLGNRISLGRAINEDLPLGAANNNPGGGAVQTFNVPVNSFATYQAAAATGNTSTGFLTLGPSATLSLPNNADLTGNPNYAPNSIYLYFTAPSGSNGSSYRSLVTRKIDLQAFRSGSQNGTTTTIPGVITPSAGATGPGSVGFLDPTRLDHNLSSNVTALSTGQRTTSAAVLWMQDDHVWAQGTNDGVSYLVQNGGPNPALADQDDSTDVVTYVLSVCTDQNGDARDGALLLQKFDDDGTGDLRLQGRFVLNIGQ